MGIRNYVFWKSSRYLGAVPMAVNLESILKAGANFKGQLNAYRSSAYLPQQKDWAGQIAVSFAQLTALGEKIIELTDNNPADKISGAVNSLFMGFENLVFKIDEFLNNSMGKSNLQEVEQQLVAAAADKQQAIFLLRLCIISALVMGTLIAFWVYRRRIEEHNYRQQLFNRMINMEESERKKLSTAVHDELGQDLSALKIYLGLVSQGALLPGAEGDAACPCGSQAISLRSKIEECKKITAGLIEKSHNIAFLLRPPDLDEVGLLESIEQLLLESRHLTGVEFNFRKPFEKIILPAEYNLLIYRLCQELLTNMAKHAQAKNVEIRLSKEGDFIELFYRDDGQGFDETLVEQNLARRKEDRFRLGLLGLKERVEVFDGVMRVNSSPGKGTSINVTLPV